jgi:5'-3' exonuclease
MTIKFQKMLEDEAAPLPVGNLLVVDAINLAFRWKHMGKFDFEYDYMRTVESLAKSYNCGKIIITADFKGSRYRKSIYPEYKENRKERFADQTEAEKKEIELFFAEIEKTLSSLSKKYLVLRFQGVEADDIAAWIAKHAEVDNIWLISSDRDWDLLVSDKISRFSYVTRKETTLLNWEEHYDFTPEQYISIKCLTGDSGDNVAGIPGIGPKRAKELVEEYGDALNIYASCPIDSKYKHIQSLNENYDRILLNYELMDIVSFHEDAIGEDNLAQLEKSFMEYMNEN